VNRTDEKAAIEEQNQSSTEHQPPSRAIDVTLVIQTSEGRQWLLRHTCDRWPGPISIVVFLQSSSGSNLLTSDELVKFEADVKLECVRGSLALRHLLKEEEDRSSSSRRSGGYSTAAAAATEAAAAAATEAASRRRRVSSVSCPK
jgi:hypothetical protein